MCGFFQPSPCDRVTEGVRTLLEREWTFDDSTRRAFWQSHLIKPAGFLLLIESTRRETQSIAEQGGALARFMLQASYSVLDTLDHELRGTLHEVSTVMEKRHPGTWQTDPSMFRCLVFSNVNAYFSSQKSDSFSLEQIWETYVDVCHRFMFKPFLEEETAWVPGGSRFFESSDLRFRLSMPIRWTVPDRAFAPNPESMQVHQFIGPNDQGFRVNVSFNVEATPAGVSTTTVVNL